MQKMSNEFHGMLLYRLLNASIWYVVSINTAIRVSLTSEMSRATWIMNISMYQQKIMFSHNLLETTSECPAPKRIYFDRNSYLYR